MAINLKPNISLTLALMSFACCVGASPSVEKVNAPGCDTGLALNSVAALVSSARCAHPQVLQARAMVASSTAGLAFAAGAWQPTASVVTTVTADQAQPGTTSSSNAQTVRLQASWLAYDRTRSVSDLRAQKVAQVASAQLSQAEDAASLRLLKAWIALDTAGKEVSQLTKQGAAALELLTVAKARKAQGLVTSVDVFQAQALASQSLYRQRGSELKLNQSWVDLGLAAGVAPLTWASQPKSALQSQLELKALSNLSTVFASKFSSAELLPGLDSKVKDSAAYMLLDSQAGLDALAVAAANSSFGPTVTTQLYRTDTSRNGVDSGATGVAAVLTVPLYTGGLKNAQVAQALAIQEAQLAATEGAKDQLLSAAQRLHSALILGQTALESAQASSAAATGALDLTMGRYAAGVGSLTETLQAYSSSIESSLSAIAADAALQSLQLDWLHLVGQLEPITTLPELTHVNK